jgi:hypothetical protein
MGNDFMRLAKPEADLSQSLIDWTEYKTFLHFAKQSMLPARHQVAASWVT